MSSTLILTACGQNTDNSYKDKKNKKEAKADKKTNDQNKNKKANDKHKTQPSKKSA